MGISKANPACTDLKKSSCILKFNLHFENPRGSRMEQGRAVWRTFIRKFLLCQNSTLPPLMQVWWGDLHEDHCEICELCLLVRRQKRLLPNPWGPNYPPTVRQGQDVNVSHGAYVSHRRESKCGIFLYHPYGVCPEGSHWGYTLSSSQGLREEPQETI